MQRVALYVGATPPTTPTHVVLYDALVPVMTSAGVRSCIVSQHGDVVRFWNVYARPNGMVVLCHFCSLDCVNAFELDPELVLSTSLCVFQKSSSSPVSTSSSQKCSGAPTPLRLATNQTPTTMSTRAALE